MNKILAFFGLTKISRVKNLTWLLHKYYVASVIDGVKRDFGAKQSTEFTFDGEKKWWYDEFDSIMTHHTDEVVVSNINPKFSCYSK